MQVASLWGPGSQSGCLGPLSSFLVFLGLPLTGIVTSRRDQRAAPPRPVHAGRDAIKVLAARRLS